MKTVKEFLEENMKLSRQLKDPKKEIEVVKNNKVEVIDKKDWPKYEKKGYTLAESLEEAKDSVGDVRIESVKMKGFGTVYEVQKLSKAEGKHAKKGDTFWKSMTSEPFATEKEAKAFMKKNK